MDELEKAKKIFERINKEENLKWIVMVLIGIILVLAIFPNIIPKISFNFEKVYKIELIKLEGDCEECFDLSLISNSLSKENINIKKKSLDYNSEEARKLIEKYAIKTIPALIVKGKALGLDENVFRINKNIAIFDKSVPYLDLDTGKIMGFVNALELYDSSCLDCVSLSRVKKQLEGGGIKFKIYEIVDVNSEKGKTLVKENNISFVPSFLLSKDIEEYWWIFPTIKNSFIEKEHYVLKNPIAPYKEILTGKIKGKVSITYLTNKSCEECFEVSQLKDLFAGIGVYFSSEKSIDVSSVEGKALVAKYNITKIPTVLFSREILDYNINEILERVGKFQDGEYVFEGHEQLKVKYQKLGG